MVLFQVFIFSVAMFFAEMTVLAEVSFKSRLNETQTNKIAERKK